MQGRKRPRLLAISSFFAYPWSFLSTPGPSAQATDPSLEANKPHIGLNAEIIDNASTSGTPMVPSPESDPRLGPIAVASGASALEPRPPSTGSSPAAAMSNLHLPAEIIHEILFFTEHGTLAASALVNHTFRHISQRLLYRHMKPPANRIISCLKTLASRPILAAITRRLTIADITQSHHTLAAYLALLSRALHNTTSLTDLTLLLDGAYANILLGCSFRLRNLSTTLHWDSTFAQWMEEQTEIDDAMFGGTFVMGSTIDSGALRKLNRVSASPLILATVVPGRPVTDVEVCLMQSHLFKEDIMWTTTKIMSFSASPLRSLQIIACMDSVEDTLAALAVIPENLNMLRSLSMHAANGSFTRELLDGLQSVTSRFEHLRSVLFLSRDTSDALHDTSVISGLAAKWHSSCKSLECVSFPAGTWVYNQKYGWVTLRELERILVEREKTVREREKELEERERLLVAEQRELELRELGIADQIKALRAGLVQFGADVVAL
ncbi:hypothetical protein BJ138DRAFT_1080146 [Hygrophoropsis aurantiaca]|uniref:Uncharacterized protein n=1 Tax=Hygrophoropsis aurantiaca TaxID=72124 RepID=A0ACB8AM83_9AGAM|nr:hypothetical protein BJ138DRAFT_1080146 [Hygrophoropsis aurantiaca]